MEVEAIRRVFGDLAANVPVVAYKAYWGETVAAAGALQLAAVLADMEDDVISATAGYRGGCAGLNVTGSPIAGSGARTALIHSFGPTGQNTAMVVRKEGN